VHFLRDVLEKIGAGHSVFVGSATTVLKEENSNKIEDTGWKDVMAG